MEIFVSNDAHLPRGREDRSREPACRQTGRKKRRPTYAFINVSKSCRVGYKNCLAHSPSESPIPPHPPQSHLKGTLRNLKVWTYQIWGENIFKYPTYLTATCRAFYTFFLRSPFGRHRLAEGDAVFLLLTPFIIFH